MSAMRPSQRRPDQLRPVRFLREFTDPPEGSVLAVFGNTKVLCTATIETGVPPFLRGQGKGWITAEYGMLPRSTGERTPREAVRGKQGGRTLEIQRLIGRSLRAAVDLSALGEHTLILDCDVLQADGGTRTAAISGAWVALRDALSQLETAEHPLKHQIAAVSVGLVQDRALLDLDYAEDCRAQTDMNVVMDKTGRFIEIQGTAERQPFSRKALDQLLTLAETGIQQILAAQREA